MNKNYIILGVIIILLVIGVMYFGGNKSLNLPSTQTEQNSQNNPTGYGTNGTVSGGSTTSSKNSGRVIFTITDDAVLLDSLQSIMLTVNNVSIQSPQKGWVYYNKHA